MCLTLEALEKEVEHLVVRGLSASGPSELKALAHASSSLRDAGATHVAGRIDDMLALHGAGALAGKDGGAARALLQLMTSLRVFERVLTLEAAVALLESHDVQDSPQLARTGTARAALKATTSIAPSDERKLVLVLEDLALAVEDIVATGLVTASSSTREKLDVSFKEASRLKLGRLAASLRYVTEEIQRYLDGALTFSGKRLTLFLVRSWILARALAQAIVEKNDHALARLLLAQPSVVVDSVQFVTLGVRKRVPQGTGIVAFDFHMRLIEPVALPDGATLAKGAPLVWSHIVARKDPGVAAEALLHLEVKPQGPPGSPTPPGFKPVTLAEPEAFAFDAVALTPDGRGGARLMLGPRSRLRPLGRYDDWSTVTSSSPLDPRALAERVRAHEITPLDLEVELAEELVLTEVSIGDVKPGDDDLADRMESSANGLTFEVPLARTEETVALREALRELKDRGAGSLFGVVHFDRCRMMLAPLSVVDAKSGPRHLMLSLEKADLKQLTRSLF